jgi:hypothetical protein
VIQLRTAGALIAVPALARKMVPVTILFFIPSAITVPAFIHRLALRTPVGTIASVRVVPAIQVAQATTIVVRTGLYLLLLLVAAAQARKAVEDFARRNRVAESNMVAIGMEASAIVNVAL